jgi:hypothetical protein
MLLLLHLLLQQQQFLKRLLLELQAQALMLHHLFLSQRVQMAEQQLLHLQQPQHQAQLQAQAHQAL